MNYALWIVQGLLALLFLFAGGMKLVLPLDAFAATVRGFADGGGSGCNVTMPFKFEACALANRHTARAERAGAGAQSPCAERGASSPRWDWVKSSRARAFSPPNSPSTTGTGN